MKKLPIAGTSAASTAFCSERIDGLGDTFLYVDGNAKITRANGTMDDPRPNAFSITASALNPEINDCPESTPTCRAACYVGGLATHASATYALYKHNSAEIRRILADPFLADDWALRLATWATMNVSSFRFHVSGDVFSLEYAAFIADVCREAPTVEFWIYTRSLTMLAPLAEVSTLRGGNLAINVSCDRDNYAAARDAALANGDVEYVWDLGVQHSTLTSLRLCYLTSDGEVPDDLPHGSVIFPDYALRGGTEAGRAWFGALPALYKAMVCPVDYHGKSEERRCGRCERCLT